MLTRLKARLSEGSSWAGISAVLGTLGSQLDKPYAATAFIGCAACGAIAVLLKDSGAKC